MQFAEFLIDTLFDESCLNVTLNMSVSCQELKLLPWLDQMLFGKLLIDLGLVQQCRKRCDLVILSLKSLLFLEELFAQLVQLLILGATVLQEDIELLSFESVVFFQPWVVLF